MRTPYARLAWTLVLVVALIGAAAVWAQEAKKADHVMVTAKDVKWADAPPSLPKGAKLAVLEGDTSKPGPFTMRLKLPDGYKVPPHWHPAVEHVTVLGGTFNLGVGEKFDTAKAKALPAGSFVVLPEKTPHFVSTKGETTIQVHGMGPWGLTYVNPADDPRKK